MPANQRLAPADRPLEQVLTEVELLRRGGRKWFKLAWAAYAGLFCLAAAADGELAVGVLFAGWLAPVFAYVKGAGAYAKAYKAIVVPRLLQEIDPGLRYLPEAGIGREAFADSLYSPGEITGFRTEDLIEGDVAGRPRRICEMSVMQGHGKGKHTVFHGLFSETRLAGSLKGHVAVVPDVAERLLGSLGTKLQGMTRARGQLVHFDDAAFEKNFAVYADHEGEARRLLTGSLRRQLLALRERVGYDVGFTVCEDKAYLLITCPQDYFRTSFSESALSQGALDRFEHDLRALLDAFAAIPLAEVA